ncbi:DUF4180 domain-containing protein [Ruminococcaceae bacterium OttesenSCG-928-L11]|nr:DUF4180 domain-containing protein [Ruminococcaceae bacterium OttesenSCG-928-L11]
MKLEKQIHEGVVVAIATGNEPVIQDVQSALDLLATARYESECDRLVLEKQLLPEAFFDLRTGLAGEILQKCVNYQMKVAVVGDFSGYESKALRDFIRESNRGKHVFFLPTLDEAIVQLREL